MRNPDHFTDSGYITFVINGNKYSTAPQPIQQGCAPDWVPQTIDGQVFCVPASQAPAPVAAPAVEQTYTNPDVAPQTEYVAPPQTAPQNNAGYTENVNAQTETSSGGNGCGDPTKGETLYKKYLGAFLEGDCNSQSNNSPARNTSGQSAATGNCTFLDTVTRGDSQVTDWKTLSNGQTWYNPDSGYCKQCINGRADIVSYSYCEGVDAKVIRSVSEAASDATGIPQPVTTGAAVGSIGVLGIIAAIAIATAVVRRIS